MINIHRIFAALVYLSLFFLLFPWYQFVIDIDAISYIHVAQRFANGEYYYSVNGYWSPLISWILVPFIKLGFDPVIASKYINGFLGLLSLFACNVLTDKFSIHPFIKKIIPYIFAVLLISFAFYELCADLLLVLLLLLYLNLVCGKDFINDPVKIIFAAATAALCYYAKAYSLPFFILHFSLVTFIALKKSGTPDFKKKIVIKLFTAFITFFILTGPYLFVLTHKYGSFRFSNAGSLNTSWFLSPGISDDRNIIAVPPFGDATSYWDEPFYAQKKWIGPFSSFHFFMVQIKIAISNIFRYCSLLNTMSILVFTILAGFIYYLFKRIKEVNTNEILLFITALLYPAGYLLIFIEWRYIWILPVCFLLMAGIIISYLYEKKIITAKIFIITSIITCCSFLYQPVNELQDLRYSYKDVYEMADVFKKNDIKGNFLLNYKSFPPYGKTVALCYLTGSKLYGPVKLDYSLEEFNQAVKSNNINYYLFYYDFPNEKEVFLQSAYARMGIKIYDHLYPGIIVVQFK